MKLHLLKLSSYQTLFFFSFASTLPPTPKMSSVKFINTFCDCVSFLQNSEKGLGSVIRHGLATVGGMDATMAQEQEEVVILIAKILGTLKILAS